MKFQLGEQEGEDLGNGKIIEKKTQCMRYEALSEEVRK